MGYSPVALEGEGSNCFSITPLVGHKVNKCNWKKYLFGGEKTKEKPANFGQIFSCQRRLLFIYHTVALCYFDSRENKTKLGIVDSKCGPVVRQVDNAIQRVNHYPADSVVCFVNTYPLDSDLSGG